MLESYKKPELGKDLEKDMDAYAKTHYPVPIKAG
jgi:hypothetical protein